MLGRPNITPYGGRPLNLAVKHSFVRLPNPHRKVDTGICKHCHWRCAWHTTKFQGHLDNCARYRDFVDAGEPQDELEQRTQDALAVMLEFLDQQPTPPPTEERPQRQTPRQQASRPQIDNTVGSLPPPARPLRQSFAPGEASERERTLEAVLGMVWSTLAATGSPEARVNSALWNLVKTTAPNALKHSQTAPRHVDLPGQYSTPASANHTSGQRNGPDVNAGHSNSHEPWSDSPAD